VGQWNDKSTLYSTGLLGIVYECRKTFSMQKKAGPQVWRLPTDDGQIYILKKIPTEWLLGQGNS